MAKEPQTLENKEVKQVVPAKVLSIPSKTKKKPPPNAAIKIKLLPTPHQRERLNTLFGGHRYVYNEIVTKATDMFDIEPKEFDTKYRYLAKKNACDEKVKDIPEECLDSSFRDVVKAIKTTRALSKALKEKIGRGFALKCLKKKDLSGNTSIEIRQRSLTIMDKQVQFFPTYFCNASDKIDKRNQDKRIKTAEQVPIGIHSVRIAYHDYNYYIIVPKRSEFEKTLGGVCAIDPGVRSLCTIYDPSGITFELGNNQEVLARKCNQIDSISKAMKKTSNKQQKSRLKKKRKAIYKKITNCVNDANHKVSKIISKTYSKVLLPKFETQQMMIKENRKIGRSTTRMMGILSHYKLKMMLMYKMERTGGELISCTEEYTSKTCTNCGRINHKLGGSKVFKCSHCKLEIDRDINGARNIYLKNSHLL